MTIEVFKVFERHYRLMVKQALDKLPEESGGFIGGDPDGTVKSVFPLMNLHAHNKTDTFSFTPDDVDRARRFFAKHQLSYLAMYHSHPKGIAYPSVPDIRSKQPAHFIIGCSEMAQPIMNAFLISKSRTVTQVPIQLLSDNTFSSVKNIHEKADPSETKTLASSTPVQPQTPIEKMTQEASELGDKISQLTTGQGIHYSKEDGLSPNSSFNTLA